MLTRPPTPGLTALYACAGLAAAAWVAASVHCAWLYRQRLLDVGIRAVRKAAG